LTAVSGRIAEFGQRHCDVLGISTDSIETHERWIATARAQGGLGGLNFPLASDDSGEVCGAYGVYVPRRRMALRGLFIIDPNGILQYQVTHNLNVGRSTDETLRVLDALQTGGLCPAEWEASQATLDPIRTLGPNVVLGPYRIEAVVGSGAFGTVFRAWDTTLERRVALKVIASGGPAPREAVLAEARAAAGLNHPNICIVHAVDPGELAPMIITEFIEGQSLEKILANGPVPGESAVSLGRQIALGMAAAHAQGVVHGDLKPGNIMVTSAGAVKIMDFGLARRQPLPLPGLPPSVGEGSDGGRQTAGSRGLSGTPSYMAPEMARGEPPMPASDVFSLGLVLYELATGRRAIGDGNLFEVLRQVEQLDPTRIAGETPEPFAGILRQALLRNPAERQITMAQIANSLSNTLLTR
jgi:serine/threonine protein kinase/peroxiredoxin